MTDSLDRLYTAVTAARDLDPATSRTARLLKRGPSKMAKKLAEEAIEVAIDAVNRDQAAIVRESADLLYNRTVLGAGAGIRPEDVWAEMDRREREFGIAEKLPKASPKHQAKGKMAPALSKAAAALGSAWRPMVAPQVAGAAKAR
mgnify:FL=1